jgi:type II secretion system (T2SS) protein E
MAERLGELLVASGVLDRVMLRRALVERQRYGGHLGRFLIEMGFVGEDTYVRALSKQLQLPAVALDPAQVEAAVVRSVPRETCERHGLVAFRLDRQHRLLDIAMADATSNEAIDEVEAQTRFKVRPFVAGPRAVDRVLQTHYKNGADVPPPPPPPTPEPTPRPAPAAAALAPEGDRRIEDLEDAVRRLEGLVLSLIGLLVENGKVDREELARRVAESRARKGGR